MTNKSTEPDTDWQRYDMDQAAAFATTLFGHLLTMARYSFFFNAALGAAMGYLAKFTEVFDPDTGSREKVAVVFAALFVSTIAVVFNMGARRAHNNVWTYLKTIRRFARESEYNARKSPGIYHLIDDLEGHDGLRRTTFSLTQCFYIGLAIGWGVYAVSIPLLVWWPR